jgi:hypothetical protein
MDNKLINNEKWPFPIFADNKDPALGLKHHQNGNSRHSSASAGSIIDQQLTFFLFLPPHPALVITDLIRRTEADRSAAGRVALRRPHQTQSERINGLAANRSVSISQKGQVHRQLVRSKENEQTAGQDATLSGDNPLHLLRRLVLCPWPSALCELRPN